MSPVLDLEKLLAPLAGDNPAGESAKYEPEYEELTAEVGKLESLSPEPVNWERVRQLAGTVLETKSKDLLAAAYLTWAAYETDGYPGLASGLELCCGLVREFWDDLQPPKRRLRGRVAAVNWLAARLERTLEEAAPGPADAQVVPALLEHTTALDEFFEEHLDGTDGPELGASLRLLRSAAQQLERSQDEEAAEVQGSAPGTPPKPAGSGAAGPAISLDVESEADVPKVLRQCQGALIKVANFLLQRKLEDPQPYRLRRLAAWMLVERPPPDRDGVTQIGNATRETAQRLEALLAGGDFRTLVTEAEASVARVPFWLDAHRFSVAGLEAMGSLFESAAATVGAEVAHFVGRFPELLEFKFADGSPFVSEETRVWLAALAAVQAPGSEPGVDPGDSGESLEPAWQSAGREARALLAKGKFSAGIACFAAGTRSAASGRERFLWRLEQAEFCRAAGKPELALPQLELLDAEAARHGLGQWEPELEVRLVRAALECQTRVAKSQRQPSPKVAERIDELFARLCGLDLEAALSIETKR